MYNYQIYISMYMYTHCAGVDEVFVASIVERGRFKAYTGCDSTMFNKVRRSANEKLSIAFRGHYVDVGKKLRYPRDYDRPGLDSSCME